MSRAHKAGWLGWIVAYALWLGVGLLLLLDLGMIRSAMQQWVAILSISRWSWWAADQCFVFFGGAGWLLLFFLTESYFRTGLAQGDLWPRVVKVYRPLLIALAMALLALGGVDIYVRWF